MDGERMKTIEEFEEEYFTINNCYTEYEKGLLYSFYMIGYQDASNMDELSKKMLEEEE